MEQRSEKPKRFSRGGFGRFVKKRCRFCTQKIKDSDYKNIDLLRRYITPSGKILGSRISGNCARHQLVVGRAIKRARHLALLPYLTK